MAQAKDLVAIGIPAEVAKRVGFTIIPISTSGATQGAGAVLKGNGNKLALVTVTTASDAITLPSDADLGDLIICYNTSSNAGVIYPQSGGILNGAAIDGSISLLAGGGRMFVKATSIRWASI